VVRHIFQACPVWIYTQSNITSIIFTWVHYTNTEKSWFDVKFSCWTHWVIPENFHNSQPPSDILVHFYQKSTNHHQNGRNYLHRGSGNIFWNNPFTNWKMNGESANTKFQRYLNYHLFGPTSSCWQS
jgi:hypothetical protein